MQPRRDCVRNADAAKGQHHFLGVSGYLDNVIALPPLAGDIVELATQVLKSNRRVASTVKSIEETQGLNPESDRWFPSTTGKVDRLIVHQAAAR